MTISHRNNAKPYLMQRLNIYSCPNAVYELSFLQYTLSSSRGFNENYKKDIDQRRFSSVDFSAFVHYPSTEIVFEVVPQIFSFIYAYQPTWHLPKFFSGFSLLPPHGFH